MISQKHYQYFNFLDEEQKDLPMEFKLYQNYPQSFYKITKINFDIPVKSHVTLNIYDIYGKLIKTIVNNELLPGSYEVKWNGKDNTGVTVTSGVYFVQLSSGNYIEIKKMMFLKLTSITILLYLLIHLPKIHTIHSDYYSPYITY